MSARVYFVVRDVIPNAYCEQQLLSYDSLALAAGVVLARLSSETWMQQGLRADVMRLRVSG